MLKQALASLVGGVTILLTHLVTAVQARWVGCAPEDVQRVYFANHSSHGDTVLLWTVLPPALRQKTRPVAAADYWCSGPVRRFIARYVFRAVLIARTATPDSGDPIDLMAEALDRKASLILFPEGTRNTTDALLLPFKSGIYRIAERRPTVEFVPVWIANLNRVLPKGEVLPIPLLCTIAFGTPLRLAAGETKTEFLTRARDALLKLAPDDDDRKPGDGA